MNHRLSAVGLLALTVTLTGLDVGCTPESKGEPVVAAIVPAGGSVKTAAWAVGDPAASTTIPQPMNTGLVLAGMLAAQGAFYNGKDYNGQALPSGFQGDEPRQCLSACPPYYSDIACHYYCWHPSYASVSHNIRGCFSQIARGQFNASIGQALYYPQIYDYCTYQPFDAVKNPSNVVPGTSTPLKFDVAAIEANKKTVPPTRPGVNAWVDEKEREAFKHVVFTWYDPMLYTLDSQQKVLNDFYAVKLSNPAYGPSETADVAACQAGRRRSAGDSSVPNGMECSTAKNYAASHSRHPQWAQIVAFMASGDPSLK